MRVIALLDPTEGQSYIERVKDEVIRGWNDAYNISEYYIHLTANGDIS